MKALLVGLAVGLLAVPLVGSAAHAGDADNTERNDDATLTPMDQGGSEQDRTITQQIR